MSHSVTITRTTTSTSNTSTLILNTGYLKTLHGLLKLTELIINAVCVGIIAWYLHSAISYYNGNAVIFFLLMVTAFLIGTFCLLASCLVSLSTGGIISKTIYELVYHSVAFVLLLVASAYLLAKIDTFSRYDKLYNAYLSAGILGLINTCLYLTSAVLASRSYRGI